MKKFKKIIAMCLATVMAMSVMCVGAFADEEDITTNNIIAEDVKSEGLDNEIAEENANIAPRIAQYVWVDTDVLNVRTGPGTNYDIKGQVYRDQKLFITFAEYDAYGVDWYRCSALDGWICSLYVRYEE